MHVTYSRTAMAPLESYDALPDEMFAGKPALAALIGRGTTAGMVNKKDGNLDISQFVRMSEMARGTYDEARFEEEKAKLLGSGYKPVIVDATDVVANNAGGGRSKM